MADDMNKFLEIVGFRKLDTEQQEKIKELIQQLIKNFKGDDTDEKITDGISYFMQELGLDNLDETALEDITEHLMKIIKSKAGFHGVNEYDFNFGGGFSNSLKGNLREQMTTGDGFQGPDSNRIGDLYTRKKDISVDNIFRHEPRPKAQDADELEIERKLQAIKKLFQSRASSDISMNDIKKILSESLNEGKQNDLVKALANLLEWAKGNRGTKSGNPYLFPEVKNALKVLGKIEGENFLDVDTKKLSEGLLNEAFNQFDAILDDISYDELRTVVFSNVENPDVKAVKREFESLLKSKTRDARFELRKAAPQIVKEIENEYN